MSAPSVVTLVGYFNIRPGNADQFRANCEEMVALRGKEPGHLASAYSFNGDAAAASREDYENADAVKRHMDVGRPIYASTRNLVEVIGVEIHGPAAELDKLRDLFSDLSPRFYVTEFGFRS
jgi:quinol monooxygenase YgiN